MEKLVYLLHRTEGDPLAPGFVRQVGEAVVPARLMGRCGTLADVESLVSGPTSEYRFR